MCSSDLRIQKLAYDDDGLDLDNSFILGDNMFTSLSGIAVHKEGQNVYVYALDSGSRKIYRFLNNDLDTSWGNNGSIGGTLGNGDGEFRNPSAIDVEEIDSNDNNTNLLIYVTDTDNNRIQVFNKDGSFKSKWGLEGSDPGEFKKPKGIGIYKSSTDSSARAYITEDGGTDSNTSSILKPRLQVFQ